MGKQECGLEFKIPGNEQRNQESPRVWIQGSSNQKTKKYRSNRADKFESCPDVIEMRVYGGSKWFCFRICR
jgi:hypothetical protein